MADYAVPRFIPAKPRRPGLKPREYKTTATRKPVPDAIVAAIRWDYEHGLMCMADVQEKHHAQHGVSRAYVAAIAYGYVRTDVKAARLAGGDADGA